MNKKPSVSAKRRIRAQKPSIFLPREQNARASGIKISYDGIRIFRGFFRGSGGFRADRFSGRSAQEERGRHFGAQRALRIAVLRGGDRGGLFQRAFLFHIGIRGDSGTVRVFRPENAHSLTDARRGAMPSFARSRRGEKESVGGEKKSRRGGRKASGERGKALAPQSVT